MRLFNNKGITMIELIGALCILGVLFALAVPAISTTISTTRNKMYISDALKLASNAEYYLSKNNDIPKPTLGTCVLMSLTYLDNGVFDEGPYGGKYEKNRSFVIAKINLESGNIEYYVRLVEDMGKNKYRGVDLVSNVDLSHEYAYNKYVDNFREPTEDDHIVGESYLIKVNDNFNATQATKIKDKIISSLHSKQIYCSPGDGSKYCDIILYAPNSND